jgi:hypothetical protein
MTKLYDFILGICTGALLIAVAHGVFCPKPVQATAPTIINAVVVPALPTRLNLAGSEWVVEENLLPGDIQGSLGYTRCDTHHIEINEGSGDKQRETLVHEIFHAYVCNTSDQYFLPFNKYYNSKTETGHEGIDRVAYVITDALSRNPGLAAYLAGGKN